MFKIDTPSIIILLLLVCSGCGVHKHSATSIQNASDSTKTEYVYIRDTMYITKTEYVNNTQKHTEEERTITHIKEYNHEGVLTKEIIRTNERMVRTIDSLNSVIEAQERFIHSVLSADSTHHSNNMVLHHEESVKRQGPWVGIMILMAIIGLSVCLYRRWRG